MRGSINEITNFYKYQNQFTKKIVDKRNFIRLK